MNRKPRITVPMIVRTVMAYIEKERVRAGERIMPQALAEQLGTSATPVREALCQLVGRDILIERHREGFYVASLTSATLRSLYAAHEQVVEQMLHNWPAGARINGKAGTYWRLFGSIAMAADDGALTGIERYIAGRLIVARKHEAAHVTINTPARDLLSVIRAGDGAAALAKSRDFHRACMAAVPRICQSMTEH